MRLFRAALLASGVVLAMLATTEAHAVDKLKRIGIAGGFAGVAGNEGDFSGYGGGLLAAYGLNDAISIRASAFASSNQIAKDGKRSYVLSQALGLDYQLDVLQIVPYFGIYAALYEVGGGNVDREVKVGAQLALGLDYVYSRELVFGIDLRAHALPGDFLRSPDNPMPFYATTFLKVEYVWGWF
ncbi:MAG: hypothetical protein ABI175_29230 [Polyangiales bacterium]